ncbi:hypothetical protein EGW08_009298 [Elysia chlorotica]|uniref:VWFD domain-containing protein n=1 Tax=Elysia chlorotica TaxID=188477 RepID=A0A433TN51_ELYCH|nr:hypothetical protein EGW08_009298 [Elysia chlorotica]
MGVSVPLLSKTLLLLLVWLVNFQSVQSLLRIDRSHFCNARTGKKVYEDHLCADLMDLLTVKGLHFERFKAESAPTFKDTGAVCTFSRLEASSGKDCCRGWAGVNCDIAVCEPSCQHGKCVDTGKSITAPPECQCDPLYKGKGCEEETSQLTEELRFCYAGGDCHGTILGGGVAMPITRCCEDLGGTTWGSQDQSHGCTPCSPGSPECILKDGVVESVASGGTATCMASGDIYRTLDGVVFKYHSVCAVGMLITDALRIYTVSRCDPVDRSTCSKDVIIEIEATTYTLTSTTLTVHDGSDSISFDISKLVHNRPTAVNNKGTVNLKYDALQETTSVSIEAFDVIVQVDADGTFILVVREDSPLKASVQGVCGNMDGDYADELALQTAVGAQKVFEKFKKDSIACGSSVQTCPPNLEDDANEACSALSTAFTECHKAVTINDYLERCRSYYCASMTAPGGGPQAAQKAVCNVLSSYNKVCTMITGTATMWRTPQLCPKNCPAPYVFTSRMRKCPIMCGLSPMSYTRSECYSSMRFSGCDCPLGMARLNDTCVAPTDCQCVADNGKFYSKGAAIVSGDHCQSCICGEYGLWQCTPSPDRCSATCSINQGRLVKTFDGKLYAIGNSCGTLQLAKSPEIDIQMETSTCTQSGNGVHVCPTFISVTYRGKTSTLDISVEGVSIVNGYSPNVYIRQVSRHIYVVDVRGGNARIFVNLDGTVHLKMKTSLYKNKLVGLCGNMDGNKDNDFTTYSQASVNGQAFLEVFTSCPTVTYTELSPVPMNPLCHVEDRRG